MPLVFRQRVAPATVILFNCGVSPLEVADVSGEKMKQRVEFVNTLRGLAAVCVVISHYFGVFWIYPSAVADLIKSGPLPDVGAPVYVQWIQFFHPSFNWGAFGVAVFFLISGFVIPASLAKVDGTTFLKNRAVRIMPIYVVGFLICLLAIAYNIRMTGENWPFSASHVLIHFFPGIRDVFGTTNIDGIIWTLEIEVKFYLVCALVAPLFRRRSAGVFLVPVACAALVAIIGGIWNPTFEQVAGRLLFAAQHIVFMFAGAAFYYAHIGVMTERRALLTAAGLMATFSMLCYIYSAVTLSLAWNYGLAFAFFWLAFSFPKAFPKNKVTDFFANISYPLYVVHGVAGYTLLAALRQAGLRSSLSLIVTTAAAIAVSYALHKWVEAPTQNFRRRATRAVVAPAE